MTERKEAKRQDVCIRNLDRTLYHQIRIAAVQRNVQVADVMNEAMRLWLGNASPVKPST